MPDNEVWSVVGAISSVVAAVAALATVIYARRTVGESRTSRREAQVAHREVLEEAQLSRNQMEEAHIENVAQQQQARSDFANAHQEQMAKRIAAADRDIRLQRTLQLERVAAVVLDLIEAARAEHLEPPPLLDPPSPFRATRIPALLARLQTGVAVLEALGGSRLAVADQLIGEGHTPGSSAMRYVSKGTDALREIESMLQQGEALDLD